MAYSNSDARSLMQYDQCDIPSRLWTQEILARCLNEVKQALRWTPLASIEVGVNRERVVFDSGVMSAISPYFSHLSLPTTAYADKCQRLTERLLAMTVEETRMFDLIIKWCHTSIDEPSPLFGMNTALPIEQWTYIWSLADTLQIINLRELILAIVKARFEKLRGCPNQLPSPTVVQYLYDARRNYDTYSESLWDEFALQHKAHPNSPIRQGHEFRPYVEAFYDSVLGWATSSPDTLSHGYSPSPDREEQQCIAYESDQVPGTYPGTDDRHAVLEIRTYNPHSPGWSAACPGTLTGDAGDAGDENEDWLTEFEVEPELEEGDYAGVGERRDIDENGTS